MNGLILLAHRSGGNGHKAEFLVMDHDSRQLSTLGLNHIRAIDGHRITVIVILERSGGRPVGAIIAVGYEMPRGNPPQQPNFVGDLWVIRKLFPALTKRGHRINPKSGSATAGPQLRDRR